MAQTRKVTKKLGELLVERGLVTNEQLDLALADQKKNGGLLGEILVGWGYTTEESIVQALSSQYEFAFVPASQYQVEDEVTALIPKEIATRYSVVALDRFGKSLTVAMSSPGPRELTRTVTSVPSRSSLSETIPWQYPRHSSVSVLSASFQV